MDKQLLREARDEVYAMLDDGRITTELGIELDGAGHWPLTRDLIRQLVALGVTEFPQIKTKFGMLRVYYRSAPHDVAEQAHALVDAAENHSDVTCIRCGDPGVVTDDFSWIAVLCPAHYDDARRTGFALGGRDADDFGDRS